MLRLLAAAGVVGAVALLLPAGAGADTFAAVNVAAPSPRTDLDVAVMNAATGARVTLPSGVNTVENELHPSISTDGKRLTFERRNPTAGTPRILVFDLSTGQSANLFNGFEAAQRPPADPAITPEGGSVATGGPFTQEGNSFFADLTVTSLTSFPNGPFTRFTFRPGFAFGGPGQVADVTTGGSTTFAYQEARPGTRSEIILSLAGISSSPLTFGSASFANPAMAATQPTLVLMDSRAPKVAGDIVFRPATTSAFVGMPTALPGIVNSKVDESQPAITADERYVAFVRHIPGVGHDRLFLWDTQTQLLLNESGVDLGAVDTHDLGNVSLYSRLVFAAGRVAASGAVTAELLQPSSVGIFVQRILGTTRILGRKAFKLKTVGRVPLGSFRKGKLRRQWDLRVAGKRLTPGRYLVTLRAVKGTTVRELAKPRALTIRR